MAVMKVDMMAVMKVEQMVELKADWKAHNSAVKKVGKMAD